MNLTPTAHLRFASASLVLLFCSHLCESAHLTSSKIDCHPTTGASKEACEAVGCIWTPVNRASQNSVVDSSYNAQELPFDTASLRLLETAPGAASQAKSAPGVEEPWCHFPENYEGYKVVKSGDVQNRFNLVRQRPSGLPNDIQELTVEFESFGPTGSLLRLKIYDSKNKRYEPKLPKLDLKQQSPESQLTYDLDTSSGRLVVRRKSSKAVLFDADLAKLIFSDRFIQLNSKLNSPFLYGLGEHYTSFLKYAKDDYKTFSFYNTDRLPLPGGTRSYGGFPFYVNLDAANGEENAHGVYLHNSNGMDIILQPDQSITFRPIGGILDFVFFAGPTPNDVVSQYQHVVGLPQLPPRWALGFHLCRYNYNSLDKTNLVWRRTREAGIPFDVQWNDIDYMDRHNDFTYDHRKYKGLPEFIEKLHDLKMHYVFLFDPGVSQETNYYPYTLGDEMDIFVKNASGQTLVGKVWNDSGRTVFPDFSNPKSTEYWAKLFEKMQEEIKFDGAWIDMNDISSFVYGSIDGCPKLSIEAPPYKPGGYDLQEKSLCLSAKHMDGDEYNLHNLYSFYEAIATYKALERSRPGKRPFVLSRSTYSGQGKYGGHWSGDVLSTWDYLRWSIPSLIEHSMYGFSLMGSDICGFVGNTTQELCARWSTLGAFYTFTRNHNDDVSIDQDPVALGEVVIQANRNALTKKYSLLPYLYSLIHRAHRFGEPAVRSMPFEFYKTDKEALKVENQFLWGDGLIISPVVEQNTFSKSTYLPKGRWYETNVLPNGGFWSSKLIDSKGEYYETKSVPITDIPLFYRGGRIFPFYPKVGATVTETVNQPIGLDVALCQHNMSHGELFLDDGDNVDGKYNHLKFNFSNNKLQVELDHDEYSSTSEIGLVRFMGIGSEIRGVKVNGESAPYSRNNHRLTVQMNAVSVSKGRPLVVELH